MARNGWYSRTLISVNNTFSEQKVHYRVVQENEYVWIGENSV